MVGWGRLNCRSGGSRAAPSRNCEAFPPHLVRAQGALVLSQGTSPVRVLVSFSVPWGQARSLPHRIAKKINETIGIKA